jgi:hypothetical protein
MSYKYQFSPHPQHLASSTLLYSLRLADPSRVLTRCSPSCPSPGRRDGSRRSGYASSTARGTLIGSLLRRPWVLPTPPKRAGRCWFLLVLYPSSFLLPLPCCFPHIHPHLSNSSPLDNFPVLCLHRPYLVIVANMPYQWSAEKERKMLLLAICSANLRPSADTWQRVAALLGEGLTASAVRYAALLRQIH